MESIKKRVLILNGGLGGREGNTGALLKRVDRELSSWAQTQTIHLAESPSLKTVLESLHGSDAAFIATGTYWDSWGSPLQKFLEEATFAEGTSTWLGKPVAVLVTMHSVGGKSILSRLQGVLSSLGAMIPPMSGMVYSLANHLALGGADQQFHGDLWSIDDLKVVVHNLRVASHLKGTQPLEWQPWSVDAGHPARQWFFN